MTKQQFEHTANLILGIICILGIIAIIGFVCLLIRYSDCPLCMEKDKQFLMGK